MVDTFEHFFVGSLQSFISVSVKYLYSIPYAAPSKMLFSHVLFNI